MKKALISPNELRYGDEEKSQSGYRVAEISNAEFEVASPLFWIDVPDDTVENEKYYDPSDQLLKDIYVPSPEDLPE